MILCWKSEQINSLRQRRSSASDYWQRDLEDGTEVPAGKHTFMNRSLVSNIIFFIDSSKKSFPN